MIKFAGKLFPSYVKVLQTKYSILPSVESKTTQVFGRGGSYDFGVEIGEREIEIDVMLIADNPHDVINKARDFATYLFYEDLQPLIILDEPDKQYMARFTGESQVAELHKTGSATLKFLCPNPYAESVQEKVVEASPVDFTPTAITNNGTAKTYPIIDLTLKQDSTSVAVISDDKFVQIGLDDQPEKTKTTVNPVVLNDNMSSLTGWTTGVGVDGGVIAGSLATNGTYFSQASGNYGTGTGWHGGAMVRSLPRQLQNFEVRGHIGFKSSSGKQVGRVEIYLLDANNAVIGKVALADPTVTGDFPYAQARAGATTNDKNFVNSYGGRKGVFGDFTGIIQIARVNRTWTAYFAKVDSKGRHHTRLTTKWFDGESKYNGKQLAKIQVHIGSFGTHQPVSTMYVTNLTVYEKTVNVNTDTNVPVIFSTGDVVTIDNERAIVMKNGEPIFSELDPSSDFFSLEKGVNGLIFSPPEAVEVSVRYRERWI